MLVYECLVKWAQDTEACEIGFSASLLTKLVYSRLEYNMFYNKSIANSQ